MLTNIENNDFTAVQNAEYALVDFNATWCGPCKMLAPIIDELAEDYADKVEFFSLDVDENPVLAAQFNIMGVPSLILFKKGEKAGMSVGFKPKAALADWIDSLL